MKTIAFLKEIIEGERTLIITCFECCLDIEQRLKGAFRFTTLANILDPDDLYQQESIASFIELKRCKKVIFVGHYPCRALNYFLNRDAGHSPITNYRNELSRISASYQQFVQQAVADVMLVEHNVILQCGAIMQHELFRRRLSDDSLSVIGVVIETSGHCRQIFCNGISYNTILLMN